MDCFGSVFDRINRIGKLSILVFVLEFVGTKIYQQSVVNVRGAKIIDKLGFMSGKKHAHRLQFNYQTIRNDYVRLIITNPDSAIVYWDRDLFHGRQSKPLKLNHKGILVNLFKKTRAKMPMDRHGRSYHLIAKIINGHSESSCQSC